MAAHRYWRLYIVSSTQNSGSGAAEILMRETSGGANVATGGTAAANANYSGWPASQAFDGNADTAWDSNSTMPCWISYDFGSGVTRDITEISITLRSDGYINGPGFFLVQYSDDNVAWETAWTVHNTSWTSAGTKVFTKPTAAATHRYWSIYFTRAQDDGQIISGSECQLRDVSGGSDLTGSGTPVARSTYDSTNNPVAELFDNVIDTGGNWWASANQGTVTTLNPQYVTYDFGAGNAYNIVEFTWRSRSDNFPSQCPTAARAYWSDDGVSFAPTPGLSFAPATWAGSNQQQVFTVPITGDSDLQTSLLETSAVVAYTSDLQASSLETTVLQAGEDSQLQATQIETKVLTAITIDQDLTVDGDVWYPKVTSLLHFDEADGSTTTTDMKPVFWYFRGGAVISTTKTKFGTSSLRLAPGSNGYIEAHTASIAQMSGKQDFSFECWINLDSIGKMHTIAQTRPNTTSNGFVFYVTPGNKLRVEFYNNSNSAYLVMESTASLAADTWYHVAFVKSYNWQWLFLDGALEASANNVNFPSTVTRGPLILGRDTKTGASGDFNGYIDEVRLTEGIARYSLAFTAPTAAFPDNGVPVLPPVGMFASSLDVQNVYSVESDLIASHLDVQNVYTVNSGYNISFLEVQVAYSVRTIPEPRIHFQILRY